MVLEKILIIVYLYIKKILRLRQKYGAQTHSIKEKILKFYKMTLYLDDMIRIRQFNSKHIPNIEHIKGLQIVVMLNVHCFQ